MKDRLNLAYQGTRWFVIIFVPFTVLQLIAFLWIDDGAVLNRSAGAVSIATNLAMIAAAGFVLLVFTRARSEPERWERRVYPSLMVMAAVILLGWIVHTHLAGTHSSTLAFLVPSTIVVFAWFFRFRDTVILFVAAHLTLALMIVLEQTGVLPYAPLFRRGGDIAEIFLNWRTVGMDILIYIAAVAIIMVILQRLRRTVEEHALEMAEANRSLQEEVEERKHSERAKARAIRQLEDALAQVKRLKGLLPVCARCKRVRADGGYWTAVEQYLADHADVSITHGLCPDCAAVEMEQCKIKP